MAVPVSIRRLTKADSKTLLEMYRTFRPLGAAQGLPPLTEAARRRWVEYQLQRTVNFGAFVRSRLVGHCIFAPGPRHRAEIAYFVHQQYRRKGIGTLLVETAIDYGAEIGIQTVWALVAASNVESCAILRHCGFRVSCTQYPDLEMAREVEAHQLAA